MKPPPLGLARTGRPDGGMNQAAAGGAGEEGCGRLTGRAGHEDGSEGDRFPPATTPAAVTGRNVTRAAAHYPATPAPREGKSSRACAMGGDASFGYGTSRDREGSGFGCNG